MGLCGNLSLIYTYIASRSALITNILQPKTGKINHDIKALLRGNILKTSCIFMKDYHPCLFVSCRSILSSEHCFSHSSSFQWSDFCHSCCPLCWSKNLHRCLLWFPWMCTSRTLSIPLCLVTSLKNSNNFVNSYTLSVKNSQNWSYLFNAFTELITLPIFYIVGWGSWRSSWVIVSTDWCFFFLS